MAKGELGTIENTTDVRAHEGMWLFDDDDWALIAMLADPIYCAELLFEDPKNADYSGTYHVRDYQYPLFRPTDSYQAFPCARDVGKTESIKARAVTHAFKRMGEDLLITAPELIHLEGVTQQVEARITATRLTRDFLRRDSQKTGFTHKPFQCVAEGQLVLTRGGHVPVEDVRVGDKVLTHRGRWRTVSATWDRGVRDVVEIKASGSAGLLVTPDHKLYAAPIRQREGRGVTGKRRMYWELGEADWCAVEDWKTKTPAYRAALPAVVPGPAPPKPFRLNRPSPGGEGNGPLITPTSNAFLWHLGHYLAEGCTWGGRLVVLSVHEDEADEIQTRLAALGITSNVQPNTGAGAGVRISQRPLAEFLDREVPGDQRVREIPTWVYGLGRSGREAVFDGLMYGDGHQAPDGSWNGSFASRRLTQSLGLLAHSLGWVFGAGHVEPATHKMKSGLVIRAGQQWSFYVNTRTVTGHRHVDFRDRLAWTAATKIRPAGRARVYDLTVEEDHSFVASGLVVSNCDFADNTRIVGRIPKVTGTGVKGQHVPDLLIDEAQDYPDNGWIEVFPTVIKDHVDADGEYDFTMHFYGVHGGAGGGRFAKLAEAAEFKITSITMLQKPGWNAQEKEAAKAMYGGSNTPDYRRNVLGERGSRLSQFFVTSRLMACMDQDKESDYNANAFKAEEFEAESIAEMIGAGGDVGDLLSLPDNLGQQVFGGMDVGLVSDPTVIMIWAILPDEKKRPRLTLVRMIHLWRFTEKQIRQMTYRIARQYGLTLRAFGQDITGLGLPLYQAMEADEQCPVHLREVSRGYVFNAKVPVAVDKNYVSEQGNQLVDQYGHIVELVRDKWTGQEDLVARMTMIEASTRYLRGFVDDGYLRLPFHQDLIKDFQGETEQRVRAMGGVKKKPNAFHMLDAARAFAMAYKSGEMEEQVYARKGGAVLDRAPDYHHDPGHVEMG